MNWSRFWLLILPFVIIACGPGASEPEINQAFARPLLSGRDVTAAYMRIKVAKDMRLVGASSAIASKIELHTHLHSEGKMQMRRLEAIDLPAGEEVIFRPGGKHLMLFGVEELLPGQDFFIRLDFASGAQYQARFSVMSPGQADHH